MYCGHCGNEVVPTAVACLKCGAVPSTGRTYCQRCGHGRTSAEAVFCVSCGASFGYPAAAVAAAGRKDWLTTLLLCMAIFLGAGGLHRFYSGHIGIGVVQLLTFGGCGLWALYDLVMILTEQYRDINGLPLVKAQH